MDLDPEALREASDAVEHELMCWNDDSENLATAALTAYLQHKAAADGEPGGEYEPVPYHKLAEVFGVSMDDVEVAIESLGYLYRQLATPIQHKAAAVPQANDWINKCMAAEEEVQHLRRLRVQTGEAMVRCQSRADAAEAECARLREALEPFAKIANQWREWVSDGVPVNHEITLGDCRRAAAALASPPAKEDDK